MQFEREQRPWGWYTVIDECERHRVKHLYVRPGRRLSYQRHTHRAEHWYAVSGVGVATVGTVEFAVGPGVSVDIPERTRTA